MYPPRNVVDMIVTSYLVVNRLAETKEFQFSPYQRQFIIHSTMSALDAEEFVLFYEDACEEFVLFYENLCKILVYVEENGTRIFRA